MSLRGLATTTRTPGSIACCLALLSLFLPVAHARAQESKPASQDTGDTVQLKSRLVNIDVMVKDKKGKFVTDLKPGDFTLVENGVSQKIEFLDPPSIVAGGTIAAPAPGGAGPAAASALPGTPRNVISLLLDAQTTELTQIKQVSDGATKYIRERIADTDVVSVFRVGNGLQLLQTFTNDKPKLIAAVARGFGLSGSSTALEVADNARDISGTQDVLRDAGGGAAGAPVPDATSQADAGRQMAINAASRSLAQFQKIRSQLSLQQSRPVIAALAAICEAQRGIPGKKILVLFSEGFVTASTQEWQVQAMVDIANRANVSIYIIDSNGLAAEAPRGGGPVPSAPLDSVSGIVSQEARIRASGGENVFDNVRHEGLNRQQDMLYRVSGDTGGTFIKNTNDIAKGLDRIDEEIRSRYTLGYYTTNQEFDGAFRKVKVEVRRPGVEVVARPGYYAIPEEEFVPLSPDDKKLLAGFDAAAASPGLPLFAELSPFRSREGRYVVPLSMEIPPGALKVDRKGDKRHMQLDVLGVIRDTPTHILSRLGGTFEINLDDQQFEAVTKNNIFFRQDVELDPGTYTFELIVRDGLSNKVAAKREQLVLPQADAELSTSGVVLSRIATPASAQPGALDVLASGGALIRPSPAHEFRAADNLIIFFNLYNAASVAPGKAKVKVTVTLMRNGRAAMKPVEYMLTDVAAEPAPHLTFAKFVSLAGLPAGKYSTMIEARDMETQKLVTRQVPFVVAQ